MIFGKIIKKIKSQHNIPTYSSSYEFCPRCEANITLQKGFDNMLPYWVCKGCGEMLINPIVPEDVAWICDGCEAMLNIQPGFDDKCGSWKCTECGFENRIDESEIYQSDDEYKASLDDPYKGMSDGDALEILQYEELRNINGRPDIVLVQNPDTGQQFIKKILKTYDVSVYKYLLDNPAPHMPKLIGVYEGTNNLVIIEEFIDGITLEEALRDGPFPEKKAVWIASEICHILEHLHGLNPPIIHRDIKPSNIIISQDNEVYLLDINVAKWYKSEKSHDTKLLGTPYYAAPEQFGYGLSASSEKSDIYAMGILLNVMMTGNIPKEERAGEPLWGIIEKCIILEPGERYSDKELIAALDSLR